MPTACCISGSVCSRRCPSEASTTLACKGSCARLAKYHDLPAHPTNPVAGLRDGLSRHDERTADSWRRCFGPLSRQADRVSIFTGCAFWLRRHHDWQVAQGMKPDRARLFASEALGTAFLLTAVVGSGIMAEKLAGGNAALALLCNTLPTGAILTVLILTFGPLSGAHFNPAVSLAFALRAELPWPAAAIYIAAQIIGGIVGVWAAHLMFELPVWQVALRAREGAGQWLAEFVATFGLLLTIFGC